MVQTFVVVGSALALVGWGLLRSGSARFTRAKAVGLTLFIVGVVLLYGAAWWWALLGLVVPGLVFGVIAGVIAAGRRLR